MMINEDKIIFLKEQGFVEAAGNNDRYVFDSKGKCRYWVIAVLHKSFEMQDFKKYVEGRLQLYGMQASNIYSEPEKVPIGKKIPMFILSY